MGNNRHVDHKAPSSLIIVLIFLIVLIPRWVGNDRLVGVDEAKWLPFSGNFYYALGQREFDKTAQSLLHPGVTTMLAGALAFHLDYPEYRGMGQGYFETPVEGLEYIEQHGHDPLELLVLARQILILVESIVLMFGFILAGRLFGLFPAAIGFIFVSLDSFYLGHSRLLMQEGLLAACLLLAILSFLVYQYIDRRQRYVILSGFAAGLAILTKSTGVIIIPFIFLIAFTGYFTDVKAKMGSFFIMDRSIFYSVVKTIFLWVIILSSLFILLFPVMWVKPLWAITRIFQSGLAYVFVGENPVVASVKNADPSPRFALLKIISGVLWKSSPIVWLGLILTLFPLFRSERKEKHISSKGIYSFWLILFALLFMLMMAMGGAVASPRYVISSHIAISFVAGLGFGFMFLKTKRVSKTFQRLVVYSMLTLSIIGMAAESARYYPYYINYSNPIMQYYNNGRPKFVGYGEVLDQAAAYLSQEPNPENLTVMSWYPYGSFSFFFPGKTLPLWPINVWRKNQVAALLQSDYLVTYYEHQKNRDLPSKLMSALETAVPVHIIRLHGYEYVRIYKVVDLPPAAFETSP